MLGFPHHIFNLYVCILLVWQSFPLGSFNFLLKHIFFFLNLLLFFCEEGWPWANICCQYSSFCLRKIVAELTYVPIFLCFMWDTNTAWLDEQCQVCAWDLNLQNPGHWSGTCRLNHYATGPAPLCLFYHLHGNGNKSICSSLKSREKRSYSFFIFWFWFLTPALFPDFSLTFRLPSHQSSFRSALLWPVWNWHLSFRFVSCKYAVTPGKFNLL